MSNILWSAFDQEPRRAKPGELEESRKNMPRITHEIRVMQSVVYGVLFGFNDGIDISSVHTTLERMN